MCESISQSTQEQAGVDRVSHVPIRAVNYDLALGWYKSDVAAQTESAPKLYQDTQDGQSVDQGFGSYRPALVGEAEGKKSPIGRQKCQEPEPWIGCNARGSFPKDHRGGNDYYIGEIRKRRDVEVKGFVARQHVPNERGNCDYGE